TTPPTVLTQSLSVELDENGTASITPEQIDNGSTDNCGIATSSLNITSFDCSHIGENTVTLSITDTSGNESSATAVVTVIETTPPTVLTQSLSVELDENGTASITPGQVNDGSSDNCGIATSSLNITNFDCSHIGENTVTLSITDASGNENSATALITIIDNEAPVVEAQDIEVDLAGEDSISIVPEQVDNGSYDNCVVTFTLNQDTFTEVGEYQVTFTATDIAGNTTSINVTVTVLDTLGVQENQKSFLSVYPVPAKDYLNFKIANNDRINSVEIYDLRGRKVQYIKSPVNTINLVDLQSGMYLFKFNLQEITLTKKIIIQ
ncbi:T9SS type A sorting domain-containing protein, partial [Mesonia sp. MT50]